MAKAGALLLLTVCSSAQAVAATPLPLYKTPGAPIEDRVADLVQRMSMEEKVNQLVLPFGAKFPADYQSFNKTGLGGTYPLPALPGQTWIETRNAWQKNAVENTRLGIPTSFIAETLHSGYAGGTNFPMPCLQGSTWNRPLVQQVAAVIGKEAAASGIDRGFSPVLHFCTDPRFGRCEESFGEDPMLISRMGEAAVTGLAGPGGPGAASTYMAEPDVHIATEAKHFAAYGFGGRDGGMPAEISDNTLYDVYLKPWYKYAQAGGRAIMSAHNEVNGMPMHANHELLTGALRTVFGFGDGLCASDAGDVSGVAGYKVAKDQLHAGAMAMKAGTDQDLEYPGAYAKAPDMLAAGLIDNATLDRAVGNVIRQKGLFDNNATLLYVDAARQQATLNQPASRELARKVAEEGITLLTNKEKRLPLMGLGSAPLKTIAVLGPNADNPHSTLGLYGAEPGSPGTVTVLQAAAEAANASGNTFSVVYERGSCLPGTPSCSCAHTGTKGGWSTNWTDSPQTQEVGAYAMPCDVTDESRVSRAAALAASADVTILVLGDGSTTSTAQNAKPYEREVATVGEHFDRDDLDPAGAQMPLMRAVMKASKSVIIVIIGGRPATFGASALDGYNKMFTDASAVIAAWHPGEEGGHALWNILNGTVNPSGHTAHTWPRTVGQVHMYVPHFLEQRTRPPTSPFADYAPATPLVPFGFGLSYSNFSYSNVKLTADGVPTCTSAGCTVTADDAFTIELDITNHGSMAGKTVVQIYFSQDLCSRVRFSKMLLGFGKVEVAGGTTSKSVKMPLKARELEMWDRASNRYVVEDASYTLQVGQWVSDPQMQHKTLHVSSG